MNSTNTLSIKSAISHDEHKERCLRLSMQLRKQCSPFAGLEFWKKTSGKHSFCIASRHWPHQLCWSWCLWWCAYRGDEKRRFFAIHRHFDKRGWAIHLFCRGFLSYKTQPYDWMLIDNPFKERKPA